MTPSQEAKQFALANGFSIEPVGRRYTVTRTISPQCLHVVGEVGGYPAALNMMRQWLDASHDAALNNPNDAKLMHCDVVSDDGEMGVFADAPVGVQTYAGGSLVLPEQSADPALNATANNCFGTLEPITPDTVPMSREEMFAPVQAELDRLRNLRVYGDERGMKGVDYPFDDFDAAAQARIRQAANRIAKQALKASGKPPGGPFMALVQYAEPDIHGDDTFVGNFATRPEALKWIRRHLSGPQGKHIIKQTISVAGVRNV